jgi:hypothetical protein
MHDLPEIAKSAVVHSVTASDLSGFGGILRCGTCRGERPLTDAAGSPAGGWPEHCGTPMTWVTLRQLAAEAQDVPPGFELAAAPDPGWRAEPGKRCVRKTGSRRLCGAPSAASRNRGWYQAATQERLDSWYPYCADHLDGRWIEAGQVMHWELQKREKQ